MVYGETTSGLGTLFGSRSPLKHRTSMNARATQVIHVSSSAAIIGMALVCISRVRKSSAVLVGPLSRSTDGRDSGICCYGRPSDCLCCLMKMEERGILLCLLLHKYPFARTPPSPLRPLQEAQQRFQADDWSKKGLHALANSASWLSFGIENGREDGTDFLNHPRKRGSVPRFFTPSSTPTNARTHTRRFPSEFLRHRLQRHSRFRSQSSRDFHLLFCALHQPVQVRKLQPSYFLLDDPSRPGLIAFLQLLSVAGSPVEASPSPPAARAGTFHSPAPTPPHRLPLRLISQPLRQRPLNVAKRLAPCD